MNEKKREKDTVPETILKGADEICFFRHGYPLEDSERTTNSAPNNTLGELEN